MEQKKALVGLCLFCFGELFVQAFVWEANLEFVILSLGEYPGETAPIGFVQLLQCHLGS